MLSRYKKFHLNDKIKKYLINGIYILKIGISIYNKQ